MGDSDWTHSFTRSERGQILASFLAACAWGLAYVEVGYPAAPDPFNVPRVAAYAGPAFEPSPRVTDRVTEKECVPTDATSEATLALSGNTIRLTWVAQIARKPTAELPYASVVHRIEVADGAGPVSVYLSARPMIRDQVAQAPCGALPFATEEAVGHSRSPHWVARFETYGGDDSAPLQWGAIRDSTTLRIYDGVGTVQEGLSCERWRPLKQFDIPASARIEVLTEIEEDGVRRPHLCSEARTANQPRPRATCGQGMKVEFMEELERTRAIYKRKLSTLSEQTRADGVARR
ncbi:MAG: hypothetical protein U0174_05760 [Polyangiaceae bacterium]